MKTKFGKFFALLNTLFVFFFANFNALGKLINIWTLRGFACKYYAILQNLFHSIETLSLGPGQGIKVPFSSSLVKVPFVKAGLLMWLTRTLYPAHLLLSRHSLTRISPAKQYLCHTEM